MHEILPFEKNPALRTTSRALSDDERKGAKTRRLIEEMKALLAKEKYGVALAAVQLGEPLALFVVSGKALARDSRNAPDEPNAKEDLPALPDLVFINPKLTKVSRAKTEKHEGCLSIRGKWGEVPRAEKATLTYLDEHGAKQTRGASGFLAHIFQHEMDHLRGVLYTDIATHLYDEKPEHE